ncbi:MAG: alpha/beta fold hydrolase [Candidatus Dormibacteria bacterium]
MPVRQSVIDTADGRQLEVFEAGSTLGPAIVVHHGTPGSGLLAPAWVENAGQLGLRLVGFSRPGYSRSSRRAGRSVAQVVDDVVVVADALGLDKLATWGISGGGPHALACAALLPERVVAASCISGVAPYLAEGLDWTEGMGEANVEEFGLATGGNDGRLMAALEAAAEGMRAASPEQMVGEMSSILSPEDEATMRGDFGLVVADQTRQGLAEGPFGMFDDDLAFVSPWGFDPASIRVPTQVWQGGEDLMVPAAHGAWLAARIPGAEAHLDPTLGHLTVVATRISEVHRWLLGHF